MPACRNSSTARSAPRRPAAAWSARWTSSRCATRRATLLGGTMHATGTLALGQNFRFDFSSFALQTQDASRLLAVATGRAQGRHRRDHRQRRLQGRRAARDLRRQSGGGRHGDDRAISMPRWASGPTSRPICKSPARSISTTGWAFRPVRRRPRRRRCRRPPRPRPGRRRRARGRARRAAAGGDRQVDRSLGVARLRRHPEPRDQRRRHRLAQGHLCRPAGEPAERRVQARQADRPVLRRRRRFQRHHRRQQGRADARPAGQPAGHLSRRDAARHGAAPTVSAIRT